MWLRMRICCSLHRCATMCCLFGHKHTHRFTAQGPASPYALWRRCHGFEIHLSRSGEALPRLEPQTQEMPFKKMEHHLQSKKSEKAHAKAYSKRCLDGWLLRTHMEKHVWMKRIYILDYIYNYAVSKLWPLWARSSNPPVFAQQLFRVEVAKHSHINVLQSDRKSKIVRPDWSWKPASNVSTKI